MKDLTTGQLFVLSLLAWVFFLFLSSRISFAFFPIAFVAGCCTGWFGTELLFKRK